MTYVENLEKAGSEQLSGNLQNVAIVERTVYVEFGKLWIQATDYVHTKSFYKVSHFSDKHFLFLKL